MLALAEAELKCVSELLGFYQNVSTHKELRDASTAADQRTRKYLNEELMREDLYKAKTIAKANVCKTGAWDHLSGEQKRLVDKILLESKRAGLTLDKEDREKLKTLKNDLSEACLHFMVSYLISTKFMILMRL